MREQTVPQFRAPFCASHAARAFCALASFACVVHVTEASALALDKQGAAHKGGVEDADDDGFNVSGGVLLGMALYNKSYAARPDNTGLTLFRYAVHADIDLIGEKLSIPIDVNLFTDRTRGGAKMILPTEGDIIAGVTSTWDAAKGSIEFGMRVEHDRPLDRLGFSQTYIDTRSRYIFSLAKVFPSVGDALWDGDISGFLTLGTFLYNPTYASRPDNSGLALFRYASHVELSVWHDHLSFGVDTTFFTDRTESHFRPTELDLTPEIIGRIGAFELHLAYERDMPLFRGGLVQDFLYAVWGYSFDMKKDAPAPIETKRNIHSP